MYRLFVLALAMLLAIALAACGDKEVATTPETSTPVQTTTAPPQPSPTPSDRPSVASVGDTINLTGQEEGERVAVTVVKVVDPAKPENEFSSPDAGERFVAVQFRLKSIGTQVVDEAPRNDAKIRDTLGQQFSATFTDTAAGPGFGGSVTLTPGDTALGFIAFEVPADSKIDRIQFTLASGFARNIGQWTVT
jgi:predicted small lipoprotein YifL